MPPGSIVQQVLRPDADIEFVVPKIAERVARKPIITCGDLIDVPLQSRVRGSRFDADLCTEFKARVGTWE